MGSFRLISRHVWRIPRILDPTPAFPLQSTRFTGRHIASAAAAAEQSAPPSERVNGIVDEISGLTLLEISDLTEVLRNKLDIKEMPVMAMMMPGAGRGGAAAAAGKAEEKVEKTAFDLKLEAYDAASKIKVIKEVRAFTDLGLKEAKELVEKAPTLLKKGVTKEEAEKIIAKLKDVGAKVSME
ncbi:54S ribosomal protein L12, mitochondrial [Linum perenne]